MKNLNIDPELIENIKEAQISKRYLGKICDINESDLMTELYYHGIDPNIYNFFDEESIGEARDRLRNERNKMCNLENITVFDKDMITVLNSQCNHDNFFKQM